MILSDRKLPAANKKTALNTRGRPDGLQSDQIEPGGWKFLMPKTSTIGYAQKNCPETSGQLNGCWL